MRSIRIFLPRYHGDLFSYEEVAVIIEKWLKASEYQEIVRETATELLSDEEAGGVQMSGETLLQRVNAVDAE